MDVESADLSSLSMCQWPRHTRHQKIHQSNSSSCRVVCRLRAQIRNYAGYRGLVLRLAEEAEGGNWKTCTFIFESMLQAGTSTCSGTHHVAMQTDLG